MKKLLLITFMFAMGYGYGRWYANGPMPVSAAQAPTTRKILYYQDPMHPAYKSDKPGIAPDCNMKLVPVYADETHPAEVKPKGERKVLFYRDPMHPSYTSDKPGKAPDCGMDLEPVYEEADNAPPANIGEPAIYISPEKQQLIGVQYATAQYGPAVQTIRAAAKVGLDENKVVRVATKMEGWIDKVNVKLVGTQVKKNQELLTIYNPQSYKAQQEFLALVKAKMLHTPDQDEGRLAAARLRLQVIGFSDEDIDVMERARLAQWKLGVYSPINGVVIQTNAIEKQKVAPDTLYTIADLSTVWVTADFLESDAPFISLAEPATLTLPSLPGRMFRGKVDSILPQLDATTRTLKVRIQFDNPDSLLKPEMYGTVELRTGGTRKLLVQQEAVLNSGLQQTVFVDRGDGYLAQRPVKIGRQFGDRVEIASGLKPGERVVVSGNFLIDSEAQLRRTSGHDGSNH